MRPSTRSRTSWNSTWTPEPPGTSCWATWTAGSTASGCGCWRATASGCCGARGRLPHYLALGVAEPWLADRALVVVDDASWPMVARATERYLAAHPGYELLFDLAAEREEDPRWWNGLRVYGFRRPPGQAAGRRASPDVAWRMLAYGLAYQPAVRLAWKTLPHHPRLASAVLKVVPMASRRVPGCG